MPASKPSPKSVIKPPIKSIKNNKAVKLKASRELYNKIDAFIDVKSLFKRSHVDIRKGMTRYQKTQALKAYASLVTAAGGEKYLQSDFAPVIKSAGAAKYKKETGIHKASRGVLIQGAKGLKSRVSVNKFGVISYTMGDIRQSQVALDATTESSLKRSIKKNKKTINDTRLISHLGTHGGKIHYSGVKGEYDLFEENALQVFNKYLTLYDENKKRANGRWAAHPSRWGMVLISEQLNNDNDDNGGDDDEYEY